MPRAVLINESASHIKAQPELQSLDRESTGRIFTDMTNMHDVVKKGIGLKERVISTLVLAATTIAGFVIASQLLSIGGAATAAGAALIAVSGFLTVYTGYSLVHTILRVLNREKVAEIEKAAAHSKLTQIIEEEQEEEARPVRGARRAVHALRQAPAGAFRF